MSLIFFLIKILSLEIPLCKEKIEFWRNDFVVASQFYFYRMNVSIELVRDFISCVGVFGFLLFMILAERGL